MPKKPQVIGVDESGKGDFFGPLVIAAFLAADDAIPGLVAIGVRDGKLLSDKRVLEISRTLRRDFIHSVVMIGPEKYNQLYEKIRNLNKLLAWGHAQAIENITSRTPAARAVSDKFGKAELVEQALARKNNEIEIRQFVRGESIVQVAAASIIARAAFIEAIDRMSAQYGLELPKGAAAKVDQAGRRLVQRHGTAILEKTAKIHFKNYQRIVNPRLALE